MPWLIVWCCYYRSCCMGVLTQLFQTANRAALFMDYRNTGELNPWALDIYGRYEVKFMWGESVLRLVMIWYLHRLSVFPQKNIEHFSPSHLTKRRKYCGRTEPQPKPPEVNRSPIGQGAHSQNFILFQFPLFLTDEDLPQKRWGEYSLNQKTE